jgi:hypothetical protein
MYMHSAGRRIGLRKGIRSLSVDWEVIGMAQRDTTDRIEENGLIAGIAVVMLIVLSLVAIASVYFGGL